MNGLMFNNSGDFTLAYRVQVNITYEPIITH